MKFGWENIVVIVGENNFVEIVYSYNQGCCGKLVAVMRG